MSYQAVTKTNIQCIYHKGVIIMFKYGMRLRGFSMGCQPMKNLIERVDDESGKYHDILIYSEKLTDEQATNYELDYLGEE